MRKTWLCLLVALTIAWPISGQAQQIGYRKEQITVNGKFYASLEKSGSVWNRNYTLRNRDHQELANAQAVTSLLADGLEYTYYEISFAGYTDKAEMEDSYDFGRRLATEFVLFRLVHLDTLNPEGVTKFLAKYPPRISKRLRDIPLPYQPEQDLRKGQAPYEEEEERAQESGKSGKSNTGTKFQHRSETGKKNGSDNRIIPGPYLASAEKDAGPVTNGRKASKEITLNGLLIRKGEKSVGRYMEMEKSASGIPVMQYVFFNTAEAEVSRITQTPQDKFSYQVYTGKDHKTRTLKVRPDQDAVLFLAEWMVKNRYL